MRGRWGSPVLPHASGWTGRLVNLEVNAGIVLHPHHTEENSYSLGGIAAPTDDLAHVVGVNVERHQNTHFIHRSLDFHVFGMGNQRFYHIFKELYVVYHIVNR